MNTTDLPPQTDPNEQQRPPQPQLLWGVLVLVAFVLGLGAGYMIWGKTAEARLAVAEQKNTSYEKTATANKTAVAGDSVQQAGTPQVEVPQNVKRYDVPVDDDPALGSDKAKITIVEFSDYQCPFCRKWQEEVFTKLEETYGDKVRLVYRDFPLYEIHPEAEPAAEAANCAGEQNKYWEYHNLLFSEQKPLGADTYTAYAQSLGLNMDSFKQCLDSHKYQAEIKADYDFASGLGVRSTPTFFINGLAVVGAQPYEVFQQVIDLELAGKIPQ